MNQTGLTYHIISVMLKKAGLYTKTYITQRFGSITTIIRRTDISGEIQYFSKEKERIRERMAETALHMLSDTPLHLVTLPHVNMADIGAFAALCPIEPSKSLAVEKDPRWFNMIFSWVCAARNIFGGEIIDRLRVYRGLLSNGLAEVPGVYNCANFDFDGCLSREVVASIKNLFACERLADDALLFITLADHIRFTRRPSTRTLITKEQRILIPELVTSIACNYGFRPEILWEGGIRYKEHTRSPMLTLGLRLARDTDASVLQP